MIFQLISSETSKDAIAVLDNAVIISWGSANRTSGASTIPDESYPDRARLDRQLAFGQGSHRRLGAPIARLEGRIAFAVLLDRLKNLRSDPE